MRRCVSAATRSAPDDVRRTSPIKGEEVAPLTDVERDIYDAGLVGTLKSIHDDIDAAVFEDYDWPSGLGWWRSIWSVMQRKAAG